MSRFTGKSDFADLVENAENIEDFYMFKDTKIYMNNTEVRIDCREDLYQFYPFLIASMASSAENGRRKYTIYLAKEPYFDTKERESLSVYLISYFEAIKSSKKNESSKDVYERWLKEQKNGLYDKDVMQEIFKRLELWFNNKEKFADILNSDDADIRFRNKRLEFIADSCLGGIHLKRCQKQRKNFIDWYDSVTPENQSMIVENIRGKLGEW